MMMMMMMIDWDNSNDNNDSLAAWDSAGRQVRSARYLTRQRARLVTGYSNVNVTESPCKLPYIRVVRLE